MSGSVCVYANDVHGSQGVGLAERLSTAPWAYQRGMRRRQCLFNLLHLCCFFKVYSRVILNIIIYFPIPEYLEGGINSLKVSGTFFFSIPGMTDSL